MSKTVKLYMVNNPVSIDSEKSLEEVMNTMNSKNLSHLLVNNTENETVGVISKTDILSSLKNILDNSSGKIYSSLQRNSVTAKELMSENLLSVKPSDSLDYAVELLLQKEFHCLPVVENGKPVGIVTFYDLLKGYYQHYG